MKPDSFKFGLLRIWANLDSGYAKVSSIGKNIFLAS